MGKCLRTMFLCDYLLLESLRREIHEGLQVIETWNSANDFILYGRVESSRAISSRTRRF
jgi:TnpA family transposase